MKNNSNITSADALLNAFSKMKAMIIGDVMIDSYIFGKVERISPEAPVPVVHISRREQRPGGAANVAINIKALGAIPILCTVTGNDEGGAGFKNLLRDEGMSLDGILESDKHKTTIKTRVIGNNHQLLRVDDETLLDISGTTEISFIEHCISLMHSQKPDVIIMEDYDKGVLTKNVIERITSAAQEMKIPVTVDPKKKNFNSYRNITLFKPNLHELISGLDIQFARTDIDSLIKIISKVLEERNIDMMMVTLSEAGVLIVSKSQHFHIPAHIRNISDVSGAGDTVISVASLCVAAGVAPDVIAGVSNLAGGMVCEEVGVVPIDKNKLAEEISKNPAIINS